LRRSDIMRTWRWSLPIKVIIGENALKEVPSVLALLGAKNILVVTDEIVFEIVGKHLLEDLTRQRIKSHTVFVRNSSVQEYERIAAKALDLNVEATIGLGGGRSIDAAKYASYKTGKKIVSIPTSISHDGVASPTVSLKKPDKYPLSIMAKAPDAVIVDLNVVIKAPKRLLASGFADILGKIISTKDAMLAYNLGEEVSLTAIKLAETAANLLVEHVSEISGFGKKGVEILAEAAIMCGMATSINGNTQPVSGSEHLFSHALDIVSVGKKSLHGEQVGIGTILMAPLHRVSWRMIRKLLKKVNAPVTAEDIGATEEEVIKALTLAHKIRKRITILGSTGLTPEAAERLAVLTKVIKTSK